MPRAARLLLALLVLIPVLSCSRGGECDKCSSDSDCKNSQVCAKFDNGDMRCGSGIGATQCRVR